MSDLKPCRPVLVVDDNIELREIVALVLQLEGFRVMSAANGAEALEMLRASPKLPCVILLDMMMPIMNGYEFRDHQRRDPHLARIPVVVVTADAHGEAKAASLGASGVLQKPVDIDALLATVGQYR